MTLHILEIGDEIEVHGKRFLLTELVERLNEPAKVVFKQPSELSFDSTERIFYYLKGKVWPSILSEEKIQKMAEAENIDGNYFWAKPSEIGLDHG